MQIQRYGFKLEKISEKEIGIPSCSCGGETRIVFTGAGCYVRCLKCKKETYMCSTEKEMKEQWKRKNEKKRKGYSMIEDIQISKLRIHPKNVRKTYTNIDELADSIKTQGILQNLTVVKNPEEEGTYWVVIGNRRLTAAIKAGLKTAPCQYCHMLP